MISVIGHWLQLPRPSRRVAMLISARLKRHNGSSLPVSTGPQVHFEKAGRWHVGSSRHRTTYSPGEQREESSITFATFWGLRFHSSRQSERFVSGAWPTCALSGGTVAHRDCKNCRTGAKKVTWVVILDRTELRESCQRDML